MSQPESPEEPRLRLPGGLDPLHLVGVLVLLFINYRIGSALRPEDLRELGPDRAFASQLFLGTLGAVGCPILVLVIGLLARWIRTLRGAIAAAFFMIGSQSGSVLSVTSTSPG